MKAAVLVSNQNIIIEDRPIPKTDSYRNILLEMLYVGICGSDMPKYFGNRAKHLPVVLGHECCGIVKEGPSYLFNKLVACIPMWYCSKCENCREGNFQLCSNHEYMSSTMDGGMQQFYTIPEQFILDVNDLIENPQLAVLIEPAAVAVHACELIFDELHKNKNKKITIIGKGTIGLLVSLVLQKYVHIYPEQINIISYGDIYEVNSADYCFECSGHVGGLNTAVEVTKYRGQILQLGIIYPEFFKEEELFIFDKLLRKEINMQGTWNSDFRDDWAIAYKLITNNMKDFNTLISRVYLLDKVNEAFKEKQKDTGIIKTLINVGAII